MGGHENQLELFQLSERSAPRPNRDLVGRLSLNVRHDQIVLAGMAGLLTVAIVFACGVERGKQLARSEHMLLARQQSAGKGRTPSREETTTAQGQADATPAAAVKTEQKPAHALPASPPAKVKIPTRLAADAAAGSKKSDAARAATAGKSRCAIQVVSFSRPQRARAEVERLQALGERAFLIIRDGRTIVYVGPFPSRDHAGEKLTALRARYEDCFVRTL